MGTAVMNPGDPGKRDGMDRAERSADPHWWQCMLECGKLVAAHKPVFITDDLVTICRVLHPNATTHEHRAIGPLMRELCRLGYCERSEDTVESRQKVNHARPMRVWRSLIYEGPPVVFPPRPPIVDPRLIEWP